MAQSELAQEMRELDSSTEGIYGEGFITGISERGSKIHVRVEMPNTTFVETFEKPKPPTHHYKFTRVAEHYGLGLVDVDALDGEAVLCMHNPATHEWEIVDAKNESPAFVSSPVFVLSFIFAPIAVTLESLRLYKYGDITLPRMCWDIISTTTIWAVVGYMLLYTIRLLL